MKKLGLIVNPIAGMGGKVGLKGTDGPEILQKAIKMGARPEAGQKALKACTIIAPLNDSIEVITCPGDMGENVALASGFKPQVIGSVSAITTAEDTEQVARALLELKVDLLLFAGGDGTARNIYNAVKDNLPVIGIPAGVKIHSAVYALNPASAGELAYLFLQGKQLNMREAEVMDIDEEAFREGRVSAKL